MTDLRKAAEIALDAFENPLVAVNGPSWEDAIQALRQALAEDALKTVADIDHSIGLFIDSPNVDETAKGVHEPVTLLPDGSAFGVMSFPLPESHWLYAERKYRDGEHEPIELGKPILTNELSSAVVSAVRYAIRGATNCGKEMDFDPDALVQNAVYALCGPYTCHVDAVNISEKRVHKTDKSIHEPVAYEFIPNGELLYPHELERRPDANYVPLYTAPPKREWVGLTDEEREFYKGLGFVGTDIIEAKLKEKNA